VPTVNFKPVNVPDAPWKDAQFRFDGKWLPELDGYLIGPNNYQELTNMRYLDTGIEGISGYSKINTTALDGSDGTLGNYPYIRNGFQLRTEEGGNKKSYVFVHSLNSYDQGRVFVNTTTIDDQGDFNNSINLDVNGNPYYEDSETNLIGRFSEAAQGNMVYCNGAENLIFGGQEQNIAALYMMDDADGTNAKDYTDRATNSLNDSANIWTIDKAVQEFMVVMTTRPIQALKIYVDSANSSTSTITLKTWTGSSWSADLVDTDGTTSGGKALAQTGIITLNSHTYGTAKAKHFKEVYLYAYLIELSNGSADLYSVTADFGMQPISNVWDGVYRQPIQAEVYDDSASQWSDYTLHVNEESTTSAVVGMVLDAMEGGSSYDKDYILLMFEDRLSGIKLQMSSGLVNTNASTMKVYYWNGSTWIDLNAIDETSNSSKTLNETGTVYWTPPSVDSEFKYTKFGNTGYAYKIAFSATLSGTESGDDDDVVVDLIYGIPTQEVISPFEFSTLYKNRLMLCSFNKGNEGSRMDYSAANAPDVFNGNDSSDNNKQSLYFGGAEKIVAATQLYNRFSSTVVSMLLVLKQNETYVLTGDTPDDFTIYPVSYSIGCPAPLTLATAEIGYTEEGKGQITRNVCLWLSHSGPVMFDGAVLSPIKGIRNFFDPLDDDYIQFDYIKQARGWVDPYHKEYNLLIPSSSGATNNTLWVVYDLYRKKWYKKEVGIAEYPQAAWPVITTNGERFVYAGIDTGYMMHLEKGQSWDGAAIEQSVWTGDFAPTGNMWDETTLRKLRLLTRKIPDTSATNTLSVYYYKNTNQNPGAGVAWASDTQATSGVGVYFADVIADIGEGSNAGVLWADAVLSSLNLNTDVGSQRLIRVVDDLNKTGWAHSLQFRISTNDVDKGFRPIAWGVQYRVERKDNTDTN